MSRALPSAGSFDHAALASARLFDPPNLLRQDRTLLGLVPEAGYIWGTLRDDEGRVYAIMRRIPGSEEGQTAGRQSLGGKLILVSNGDGNEQLQLRPEPRNAIGSDAIVRAVESPTSTVFASTGRGDKRAMKLRLSAEDFHYHEHGVIDVSGSLVASPLQWYLPGPDASLLYLTQTWLVEGQLVGRNVRGFLFWEEAWMQPGGRLYIDKDPLHDAEYLTWYSWANHYTDGSSEVGHFLFGNGDFHVGVTAHSDGTVRSARAMDAVISRDADGYWHSGIDYELDGVKWVCEPDPNGRMQGLGKIPNPQQEGRIHRVDDDREPLVWMAWGETVPATGERRRR